MYSVYLTDYNSTPNDRQETITKEKVYMLGENEFAHSNSFNVLHCDNYRKPLKYDDFNKTWFTSLQVAKAYLGGKFKRIETGYWEQT